MRILLVWLINALSLLAVPYVLPSVSIDSFYVALVTALLLGLVNTLIRPLLVLVTLPITILTLGLFTLVINGLLFWFVASFVARFPRRRFLVGILGRDRLQRDFVGGELAADTAARSAATAAPAARRLYRFDLAPAVGEEGSLFVVRSNHEPRNRAYSLCHSHSSVDRPTMDTNATGAQR